MTNRERLAQMTNEQLAAELCANHFYFDCSACPAEEICDYGDNIAPAGDGLIKWLNKKVEDKAYEF